MARALVLGGGGARGAYQVGMLDVLVRELELDFDIIRGVSVGALNAAFLAQAPMTPDSLGSLKSAVGDLLNIWTQEITGNSSIYKERTGGFAGLAAGADSLFDNEPLWKLMKQHLDAQAMRDSSRDFKVGVADLVQGRYSERGPDSPGFPKSILASTAIPVVFPPVWRKATKEVLVDGGVREITPLASAFRAQPTEIYVLMTSRAVKNPNGRLPKNTTLPGDYDDWDDNFIGTRVSGIDVLERTVDILTDEIYLDDIRGALTWNAVLGGAENLRAAAGDASAPANIRAAADEFEAALTAARKRHVPIHVIAPRKWYGKANSATAFDPTLIDKAIQHGRKIARDPSKWLWP
jgi:NTE family protein